MLVVYVLLRFVRVFFAMLQKQPKVCNNIPKRVGDFWVTSAAGEKHVRLFYAWLQQEHEMHGASVASSSELSNTTAVNPGILKSLYPQHDMWMLLERDGGETNLAVHHWLSLVHTLFISQITQELALAGTEVDVKHLCTRMVHLFQTLISYSNVYMHAKFPIARHNPTFLRTVLRIALTCSAELGFLPGFLLFAHLCPELVTDNCYPVLNNDTHIYQELVDLWDVEQLSQLYANLIYKYDTFVNL